jgi:hypothetical protein
MIGHQAIGQQSGSRSRHRLFQNSLKGLVVGVLFENGHPAIRTIEYVINQPTVSRSFWSSHNHAKLPTPTPNVNIWFLTPLFWPISLIRSLDIVSVTSKIVLEGLSRCVELQSKNTNATAFFRRSFATHPIPHPTTSVNTNNVRRLNCNHLRFGFSVLVTTYSCDSVSGIGNRALETGIVTGSS